MSQQVRVPITPMDGFWPNAGAVGPGKRPNALIAGKNMMFLDRGLLRSVKGLGAAPAEALGGQRLYNVGNTVGAVRGKGSVVPGRGGSYVYVSVETGAGVILIGGLNFNGTGRKIRYSLAGIEYQAGLAAPPAPTIDEGASGTLNGAFSVMLTRVRTNALLDGGTATSILSESNGSPKSNTKAVENKKIKVTFPAVGVGLEQHNAWGVYFTEANTSEDGPWLRLKIELESTVAGGSRVLEYEFADGSLLDEEPPTSNDPPPDCDFVATLGNVRLAFNCYGLGSASGTFISPSKPGLPEAFPPLGVFEMSPPEPVVGFAARAAGGGLYIWGLQSVSEILLTGSTTQPAFPRAVWPEVGIPSPHGGCWAQDDFFAYTNQPARAIAGQSEPDTTFGHPVAEYMRALEPDASKWVVGFDPESDSVVYATNDTAVAYHRRLSNIMGMPIWSLPIDITTATEAAVVSMLTYKNKLLVGRDNAVYGWETGITNLPWFMVFARQDEPSAVDLKTFEGYVVHAKATGMTVRVFFDDADVSSTAAAYANATLNDALTGWHYTKRKYVNKLFKNFALRIDGVNAGEMVDGAEVAILYTPGQMI